MKLLTYPNGLSSSKRPVHLLMNAIVPFLLFLFSISYCLAQESPVLLTSGMFDADEQVSLADKNGWLFKSGNALGLAGEPGRQTGWQAIKPTELTTAFADKNGRVEGWFFLPVQIDSSLAGKPLVFLSRSWANVAIYLDGKLMNASDTSDYRTRNPKFNAPIPFNIASGEKHVISIHFIDYTSTIPLHTLKSEMGGLANILTLSTNKHLLLLYEKIKNRNRDVVVYLAVNLLLFLFLLLLSVQNNELPILWYSSLLLLLFTIISYCSYELNALIINYQEYKILYTLREITNWVLSSVALVVMSIIFRGKVITVLRFPILLFVILSIIVSFISPSIFGFELLFKVSVGTTFFAFCCYLFIFSWLEMKGAKLIFVISALLSTSSTLIWYFLPEYEIVGDYLFYLSLPIGMLLYITQTFREILVNTRKNAKHILALSEEKKEILASQNELLEQQVVARTSELSDSLTQLKIAQNQLIQQGKLASLGELMAGIAHEIQNPLNFVTNFSEVSSELVIELETERERPDRDVALEAELLDDLKQNLAKITLHGGRAAGIVRGMLEHSRSSTGERQPTDINALTAEYLRLSYYGLRRSGGLSNDENGSMAGLTALFTTDFAPDLPLVSVVPQDMGRVLMNLFNNAFYAVSERAKKSDGDYKPLVNVSTQLVDSKLVITVTDNGTGMSDAVKQKIFQPFFTTKPTGQGTGLGLSLSYDIITRGHGGTLTVESRVGEGAEFVVRMVV